MKVLKHTGKPGMELMEAPRPELTSDHDVLIRMQRVGVCGSDVHYFTQGGIGSQRVVYPFAVGHEGSGAVESVGSAVTRVRPGQRICFDPAMPCYECSQCRIGRVHTCLHLRFLACPGQAEGCLGEYLVMPERSCYALPDDITMEEAAIVEPLSIGLWAAHLAGDLDGKAVGILGCGPIGLSVLLAARDSGVSRVYMTDLIDARLSAASNFGADWAGNPLHMDVESLLTDMEPDLLDCVFECTGEQDAMDQALHLLKPGGMLLLIGIPGASNRVSFDINIMRRNEICIQNVRRQNNRVQPAIDLIASKRVDVKKMVTHRFALDQTKEAFDLVADYRDGVVKAMIAVEG